jgi:hypothetical protein
MRVPDPRAEAPSGERMRPQRGRKNTRRWCRGKVGVEHNPAVVIPPNVYRQECRSYPHWRTGDPERWWCGHKLVCLVCGKVLKWAVLCPEKPEGMRQMWLPESEQ